VVGGGVIDERDGVGVDGLVVQLGVGDTSAGGSQQVLPHEIRPGQREGHDVLQLVAEPERAARLVVRRSCPQPAAHVLIEKPPVHQEVEGVVRRTHLNCVERRIPRSAHSFQRGLRGSNITVPAHQLARMVHILPLAEEKHEAVALTGELIERSLELTDIMKPSRHLIQP